MKQFNSNSKDFIAIEVEESSNNFDMDGNWIIYLNDIGGLMKEKKLPEGKWKIILCTNSYKEEDAALIVEKYPSLNNLNNYPEDEKEFNFWDYIKLTFTLKTSTESFKSLMESIGCPIVNKYGEEPHVKTFETHSVLDDIEDYNESSEKWKAEQSKIKTFIILQKI